MNFIDDSTWVELKSTFKMTFLGEKKLQSDKIPSNSDKYEFIEIAIDNNKKKKTHSESCQGQIYLNGFSVDPNRIV